MQMRPPWLRTKKGELYDDKSKVHGQNEMNNSFL